MALAAHRPGQHRRHRVVVLAAVAAALALAGSGPGKSPAPPVTQTAGIGAAKGSVPTPTVPSGWPLTGVAGDAAQRPALAVKIENSREARPQTGLEQTDMVWEEVVEGGITRFVAVFHSQVPAEVGPVRSVRPMDPKIIGPMKGLVAFSGGQPDFVQALSDAGLQVFSQDNGAPGFVRKKGVGPAPHNVYGTPSTWWSKVDGNHQASPPEQFVHARTAAQATAVVAGTPAATLAITMSSYSHPSWAWDGDTNTWLRSEGTTSSVSRGGVRLSAVNVIVLRVKLIDTGTRDPAGNPVPETVLDGSGDALVATGGKTIAGRWSKGDQLTPVKVTAADGSTIALAPGNTWIELVPTDGSVATS